MDVIETESRHQELSGRWFQALGSLDQVAGMTVVHRLLHGVGHPPPDVVCSDKSLCCMDSGMVDLMRLLDDPLPELDGDDDVWSASGHLGVQQIARWQVS